MDDARLLLLSQQQRKVLAMVEAGRGRRDIGEELGLTYQAIDNICRRVEAVLGKRIRSERAEACQCNHVLCQACYQRRRRERMAS